MMNSQLLIALLFVLAFFSQPVSADCCLVSDCYLDTFWFTFSCVEKFAGQCTQCFAAPTAGFFGVVVGVPAGIIFLSIIACCLCCRCCCCYSFVHQTQKQEQQVLIQQGGVGLPPPQHYGNYAPLPSNPHYPINAAASNNHHDPYSSQPLPRGYHRMEEQASQDVSVAVDQSSSSSSKDASQYIPCATCKGPIVRGDPFCRHCGGKL